MIDILELDPTDRSAVNDLVELLHTHCTADQCEQFLEDLYAWDRSIPDEAHMVMSAYTRMVARDAFVPSIVRKYIAVTDQLAQSPRWEEIQQWRAFIASLPATTREVA